MSVQIISPRMQKALRDNKPPLYFADIWLSVLNDTVDSQADFLASGQQGNMDFTTKPGFAQLAKQAEAINQTNAANSSQLYGGGLIMDHWQSFKLPAGRWITSLTLWPIISAAGADAVVKFDLYSSNKELVFSHEARWPISTNYDAEYTIYPSNLYLDEGTYWLKAEPVSWGPLGVGLLRYSAVDRYSEGQLDTYNRNTGAWTYNIGDLYFKLNMQKYQPSGFFRTKRLDMGETPRHGGTFQMAYSHPETTRLSITLYGYTLVDDASPAVTITNAADGQNIPAYRYWEVLVEMGSNAGLDQTPVIDMIEFLFPKDSLKLREADKALRHADIGITGTYEAMLTGVEYRSSDIKPQPTERVASGGELSAALEDPTGSTILRVISDSPLKNYRAVLYLGADVPGFSETDLLRFFIGTVQAVKYKPRYRRKRFSLALTFKNSILDLKRKVPQPTETGAVTLADISINYDGTHVIDAMLDLLRGEANIPARYINLESFAKARNSIGDAALPAAAHVVRRSITAGLPDTRIKSPEEVGKLIGQLALIADVYVTIDESSRITLVKYDAAAVPEAAWADEDLVRSGLDAVPIEDVADINLGYDGMLFNASMFGAEWNGSGGDWTAFGKVFAHVDGYSADEFAPGKALFLSLVEKGFVDASKWLGPQAGYNGETIAQALAARYVARYAYPPVVMTGVVAPTSEFIRTLGAVITFTSPAFAKLGRRGIAESEIKKFMILSKKIDRGRNRIVFSLIELT